MYNENKFEKGHSYCPPVYGNETCNTTEIKEMLELLVPITVDPALEVGNVAVTVGGEPCVRPLPCSSLSRNGICKFLVTQKLCVQVPITFNATARANDGLSTDCFDHRCPRQC